MPLISARAGTSQGQEKDLKKKKNREINTVEIRHLRPLLLHLGRLEAASLNLELGEGELGTGHDAEPRVSAGRRTASWALDWLALHSHPRLANCDFPSVVDFLIPRLAGVRPERANGK